MGKEMENGNELARDEILSLHTETWYISMMLSHKLDDWGGDRKFVVEEKGGKWDLHKAGGAQGRIGIVGSLKR